MWGRKFFEGRKILMGGKTAQMGSQKRVGNGEKLRLPKKRSSKFLGRIDKSLEGAANSKSAPGARPPSNATGKNDLSKKW